MKGKLNWFYYLFHIKLSEGALWSVLCKYHRAYVLLAESLKHVYERK